MQVSLLTNRIQLNRLYHKVTSVAKSITRKFNGTLWKVTNFLQRNAYKQCWKCFTCLACCKKTRDNAQLAHGCHGKHDNNIGSGHWFYTWNLLHQHRGIWYVM